MAATYYLGFRMGPDALTIAHRLTTSPIVHQLVKHWQGISLYTYRNGALEDNSYPAYEWQTFRFSNPIPLAVHETYAPADLAKEVTTGHRSTSTPGPRRKPPGIWWAVTARPTFGRHRLSCRYPTARGC